MYVDVSKIQLSQVSQPIFEKAIILIYKTENYNLYKFELLKCRRLF